jgi:prephenate dehydrogenase
MMRDILMTNSGNVLLALRAFQNHLARMEDLLQAGDFERLSRLLKEGAENKENIYASKGALL